MKSKIIRSARGPVKPQPGSTRFARRALAIRPGGAGAFRPAPKGAESPAVAVVRQNAAAALLRGSVIRCFYAAPAVTQTACLHTFYTPRGFGGLAASLLAFGRLKIDAERPSKHACLTTWNAPLFSRPF